MPVETATLLRHIHLWEDVDKVPLPEDERFSVYFQIEGEHSFVLDCTKNTLSSLEPYIKKWIPQKTLNELLRD